MDNTSYIDIRELLNKFIKKDYWHMYTAADIFYINDTVANKESFLTFVDSFYDNGFGIQYFNNKDGFNYVHDIFTSVSPEFLTVSECDSICAIFVDGDELTAKQRAYLKKRNLRCKAKNNLIVYRFKKGYEMDFASLLDEKKIFKAIELLDSILRLDKEIVNEAFKEDLCAYVDVNPQRLEYTLIPRPLPYLEQIPRRKKPNLSLACELKDIDFLDDDVYLFSSYLPMTLIENKLRPLAVYLIYPRSNKHYLGYIIDKPGMYDDKLYTIIYDSFINVGKPLSVTFSSRDLYASLSKTLEELNIEVRVDKNKCQDYPGIANVMSRFYTEELCESHLTSKELYSIMDSATKSINAIDYNQDMDLEYEEENLTNDTDLMVS